MFKQETNSWSTKMTFFKQPNFTNQNFEYKPYTKKEKKETKPAKT